MILANLRLPATSNEISGFVERYADAKQALGESLGMADDLLHVHLGLAVFVLTALLMRRRIGSWWPLVMVAVFAVANEVVDYFGAEWTVEHSALDIVNTILWPLMLFALARRRDAAGSHT